MSAEIDIEAAETISNNLEQEKSFKEVKEHVSFKCNFEFVIEGFLNFKEYF